MSNAVAVRRRGFTHDVTIRGHTITSDEPVELDGDNEGPTPMELLAAALASCTAITMEMYANRKEWEIDGVEVEVGFELDAKGGCDRYDVAIRLPKSLSDDQRNKLLRVAGKCPVHRSLASESIVSVNDHVEVV